jgi:hypothetical protein
MDRSYYNALAGISFDQIKNIMENVRFSRGAPFTVILHATGRKRTIGACSLRRAATPASIGSAPAAHLS